MIEPKGFTILLGIFETETFNKLSLNQNIQNWFNFSRKYKGGVMDIIQQATNDADMIIFILDDVQFPISPEYSVTCRELELICKDENLFNKTTFVRHSNIINFDKNLVL